MKKFNRPVKNWDQGIDEKAKRSIRIKNRNQQKKREVSK